MAFLRNILKTKESKHEKFKDKWGGGDEKDPVKGGVIFYVDYLGSILVEELLDEGESYGNKISSKAVKTIVEMAKSSNRKNPKMEVNISAKGIKVRNLDTNMMFTRLSIYRICFCTADKNFDKVFAYIARSTENETMECHAFLCPKRKMAQAITLTIAQSFQLAKEEDDKKERLKALEKEQSYYESLKSSTSTTSSGDASPPISPSNNTSTGSPMTFEDSFTDQPLNRSRRSPAGGIGQPYSPVTLPQSRTAPQVIDLNTDLFGWAMDVTPLPVSKRSEPTKDLILL